MTIIELRETIIEKDKTIDTFVTEIENQKSDIYTTNRQLNATVKELETVRSQLAESREIARLLQNDKASGSVMVGKLEKRVEKLKEQL